MIRFARSLGAKHRGWFELSQGDRMNRYHITSLGTMVLLLGGMLPKPGLAAKNGTRDDDVLQEVVVTAEKRAEGQQNKPNAKTAISGNTLEKASVRDVSD